MGSALEVSVRPEADGHSYISLAFRWRLARLKQRCGSWDSCRPRLCRNARTACRSGGGRKGEIWLVAVGAPRLLGEQKRLLVGNLSNDLPAFRVFCTASASSRRWVNLLQRRRPIQSQCLFMRLGTQFPTHCHGCKWKLVPMISALGQRNFK